MSAEDTEEYQEEHEEVIEEPPKKGQKGKKKPLTEKELEQRRTALARAREIKKEKVGAINKQIEVRKLELELELKKKKTEPIPIPVEKPTKPKKKVQRVVEVSDDSSDSEEVEEVYVKKPKPPKKGIPQTDYMEMVKQTNAETLRKQLENERVRLAMASCFPNMKF